MKSFNKIILVAVSAAVLHGCASTASAPIDSRNNQKQAASPLHARPQSKTAASLGADYHVVQAGDTLYSIAWHYGLNVRELASSNGIRSPYTIYKGQRLRVKPGNGQQDAKPVALQQPASVKAVPAMQSAPRTATKTTAPAQPRTVAPTAKSAAPQPVTTAPAGKQGPTYDGKWVWPTRGRVLTPFQPSGTGKHGIDIGGHEDQPVKAAANGKVVYAGSGLVGYGRLIIVKHDENLLSAYGHNNKLLVKEGEHVAAGQLIAKMGSSGTNRNELYFEIRKNGKPTNPLSYLPKQ